MNGAKPYTALELATVRTPITQFSPSRNPQRRLLATVDREQGFGRWRLRRPAGSWGAAAVGVPGSCPGRLPHRADGGGVVTDSLVWTGSNVAEMETFATEAEFGFVVGSDYHNWRWWHHGFRWVADRLHLYGWTWLPPDDPTVLEIYPLGPADMGGSVWTTARPGDRVHRDGSVTEGGES